MMCFKLLIAGNLTVVDMCVYDRLGGVRDRQGNSATSAGSGRWAWALGVERISTRRSTTTTASADSTVVVSRAKPAASCRRVVDHWTKCAGRDLDSSSVLIIKQLTQHAMSDRSVSAR